MDTLIEDITQEIDNTQNLAYKQMKDGIMQFESEMETVQTLEMTDKYHSQVYSSALDSKEEHPIWSILTDNLSYVKDRTYEGSGFKPSEGYEFRKWKGKRDLTKNPINYPQAELEQTEDKYARIGSTLKDEYHPDIDISTTYLWSEQDASSDISNHEERGASSWFRYGKFPLSEGMTQVGH